MRRVSQMPEMLRMRTSWLWPALPLVGALFGLIGIMDGWIHRQLDIAAFGAFLTVVMLYGARSMSARRLDISPNGLYWEQEWILRKRHLNWSEIVSVEFQVVSGFMQPQLVVRQTSGKVVAIPLPYVGRERTQEAVALIQRYLTDEKRSVSN